MAGTDKPVEFKRFSAKKAEAATLIEGLPGHGLVAAITAAHITDQLDLTHLGSLDSELFPQVASYSDGRLQDAIRVYGEANPAVITLQSDVVLPQSSYRGLAHCLQDELATEFKNALFFVGAPAQSDAEIGDIHGVASTDELEAELQDVGIPLAAGTGLIGGVTGALAKEFFGAEIPTTILIVKTNPFFPDPTAAQSLIENAVEPLVDFEIETTALAQQAEAIEEELEQVATQYQQIIQEQQDPMNSPMPNMYQ
ncbi:proteasome assembly chaperone family protein [Haladaptatus caseinilyticus]|uniref:proteasome assembly chaperone family protein n=1 Tax=Haladaptatus caseinilyticus TaxID=2993314 RepID=UPI00224A5F60|nr:PAC2 family protein [Haladaptatus caseinilyticus]